VLLGRIITLGLLDNMGTSIALPYTRLPIARDVESWTRSSTGCTSGPCSARWNRPSTPSKYTVALGIPKRACFSNRVAAEDLATRGVTEERFHGTLYGMGGAGGFPPADTAATVATRIVSPSNPWTTPQLMVSTLLPSASLVRVILASTPTTGHPFPRVGHPMPNHGFRE
jgi:hypothetical protein